jgi:hypothetical protein
MYDLMSENRTITLTNEQWINLATWLQVTSTYGADRAEFWEGLAEKVNDDGSKPFPRAEGNAKFYREKMEQMEKIRKIIEG